MGSGTGGAERGTPLRGLYNPATQRWELCAGDLAFYITSDRTPVPVQIELVTDTRIYYRVTLKNIPEGFGEYGYEARFNRKIAPRNAVYVSPAGKASVDWASVAVADAA